MWFIDMFFVVPEGPLQWQNLDLNVVFLMTIFEKLMTWDENFNVQAVHRYIITHSFPLTKRSTDATQGFKIAKFSNKREVSTVWSPYTLQSVWKWLIKTSRHKDNINELIFLITFVRNEPSYKVFRLCGNELPHTQRKGGINTNV